MIVRRTRYFDSSSATESDFDKGVQKGAANEPKMLDTGGSSLKVPPPPNISDKPSVTMPAGPIRQNQMAVGRAEKMMAGGMSSAKTFSYQPTMGNSYIDSIQVVDDKVVSPIENLSNKIGEDEILEKPTRRFRTAIKGYIDGIRLLKRNHGSKKKTSRKQRRSGESKK